MSVEDKLAVEKEATVIKNSMRGWLCRKNYSRLRDATVQIQAFARGTKERSDIRRSRQAAVKIASAWKDATGREKQRRAEHQAATTIQRSLKDWVEKAKAAVVMPTIKWEQRERAAATINKWTSRHWKKRRLRLSNSPKNRQTPASTFAPPPPFSLDSFASHSNAVAQLPSPQFSDAALPSLGGQLGPMELGREKSSSPSFDNMLSNLLGQSSETGSDFI